MALYFDAVIGTANRSAAESLLESLEDTFELHLFSEPIRQESSVFYFSVFPRGLGFGVPYDSDEDRKQYGHQRTKIVKKFYAKIAAEKDDLLVSLLGWEIRDAWFDPTETNRIDTGIIQIPDCLTSTPGLVVSSEILKKLPKIDRFAPFTSRHHWIPIENWDKIDSWNRYW